MTTPGHDASPDQSVRALDMCVRFAERARAAGLAVTADTTALFVRAVAVAGAETRAGVYWSGRATMVRRPDDIAVYDAVFASYFRSAEPQGMTASLLERPRQVAQLGELPPVPEAGGHADGEDDALVLRARASSREVLRQRDIAHLTAAERAEIAAMLRLLGPRIAHRLTARRSAARRGRVDQRRILRAMIAAGGELRRPPRYRRRLGPRRVVLLIDVSGSMAAYADTLLRFAHVLIRSYGAAAEVFTIGTRLSRVTRALRLRDPEQALAAAAAVIPDFSGGTRLGEVLAAFNRRWGQRGGIHGAVVVIFSDGWERGSAALLGDHVERVRRRARAVFWVNPHTGHEGYQPVQSGIVAALPHVDRLIAGHSLAALEELLGVMADA